MFKELLQDLQDYKLTVLIYFYGIKFNDPGYITVGGPAHKWIQELQTDINKNGAPEIIVFYLAPYEEKFYP